MSSLSSRASTPLRTTNTSGTVNTNHIAHSLLSRAHDPSIATAIFADKVLHKPLLLSTSEHSDNRAKRRHIRLRKKAYYLKHARPKPLSAKERRDLGLYDLDRKECSYDVYKGLHKLWNGYILELLGFTRDGVVLQREIKAITPNSAGSLLASADYHGMEVEVVRCTDVGRVGLKGIVVRETRSTFTIVCDEPDTKTRKRKRKHAEKASGLIAADRKAEVHNQQDEQRAHGQSPDDTVKQVIGDDIIGEMDETGLAQNVRHVPKAKGGDKDRMILKKGAVFRVVIQLPIPKVRTEDATMGDSDQLNEAGSGGIRERRLVVDLHGDQLEVRPVERAVKKFKWRAMDYL